MTPSFQRLITLPGARLAVTALALSLVVAAALIPAPAIAAAAPAATRPFTGFCHCSGTFIPDCNTKADCEGAPCLRSPTFC